MGVASLDKIKLVLGTGLQAKMARGVLIFGSGTVTDRGLKFIRNIILARILASEEFGLMAIVMVAPTVFEMFTQVGVNHSVIQSKRGSDSEYLNAAWWVQAIQSLVLFVIGIILSPLISSFYNKPQLLSLLRVAFLVILFRGFVSPRMNVLRKEHKYGRVVLLSLGSGVTGTFVAIALAFVIQNVWALVIGLVSEAAILCIVSYVLVPFMPRLGVERKSLSELMRFVLGLLGSPVLVAIAVRAVFAGICGLWANSIFWLYLRTPAFETLIVHLLLMVVVASLRNNPLTVLINGVVCWAMMPGVKSMFEMVKKARLLWRLLLVVLLLEPSEVGVSL